MPNKNVDPMTKEEDFSCGPVQQLLHEDHERVADLFFQFSQTDEESEQETIVKDIIKELFVHASVEEEIVYPAVRKEVEDSEDMMDEADTEHHMIKILLAELSTMKADDDFFKAKVTVLAELVKHHVEEEEKEMFKEIHDSDIDPEELGKKMAKRKEDLEAMPVPKIDPEINSLSLKAGGKAKKAEPKKLTPKQTQAKKSA